MMSAMSEFGLPAGQARSGGQHLVCRGGSAATRQVLLDELARELAGDYRVLVQRGEELPGHVEAGADPRPVHILETGPDGLVWNRPGLRDHFQPLEAWDSAELVLRSEAAPGSPVPAWFAMGQGLPSEGLRLDVADPEHPAPDIRRWLVDHAPQPPLLGLVLAGGHSRRMGRDKSLLEYNGVAQWQRAFELLEGLCGNVFLSRRADQPLPPGTPCLTDRFVDFGPVGGLLTALHAQPEAAWLVLACDLPSVDEALLRRLVAGRKAAALATAFVDPGSGLPEPLCAIWEPRMRARLHRFMGEGVHCPRKVLIRSSVALLELAPGEALLNVNRPEDHRRAQERKDPA